MSAWSAGPPPTTVVTVGRGSEAERAPDCRALVGFVAPRGIERENPKPAITLVTTKGGAVTPERPGQVGEALPTLLLDLERKLLLDAAFPSERAPVRLR